MLAPTGAPEAVPSGSGKTGIGAATAGSESSHHLTDIAGPISVRCLTPSAWAQTPFDQLDVVREPGKRQISYVIVGGLPAKAAWFFFVDRGKYRR
jgi:hypothetical protein